MKEIFISYSTVDMVPAETVRSVLENNGLSCWMAPRDIPGGSNYTKEIPIAIRNCKIFVLILSKNAQASQWVLKELDSAVNCGKVILPFMLEECILNDEFNFLLTGAQRYAAYQKKAEVMENLVSRIRSILDVQEQPVVVEPVQPVEKAPVAAYTGEVVCSACGGSDLKLLPKRIKRQGILELSTMLLIPVLSIVTGFLAVILAAIFLPAEAFEYFTLLFLAGMVGGGIWGNAISRNTVHRWRVRKHIHSTCYRCNSCSKVFRHDEIK